MISIGSTVNVIDPYGKILTCGVLCQFGNGRLWVDGAPNCTTLVVQAWHRLEVVT